MTQGIRFEGMSLTVDDVERSLSFYRDKLKLDVVYTALPGFALVRAGAGTIGLLSIDEAKEDGVAPSTEEQRRGVHVEFSTDHLDELYAALVKEGVTFLHPPQDEPWERSMTALDPDGYAVQFSEGARDATISAEF